MDSLPTELLSIIFMNTLTTSKTKFLHDSDRSGFAHALICSMCRRWNEVALSTPGFWSQITISSDTSCHDAMKRRLRLSQQSKLDIHVRLSWLVGVSESFREVHSLLVKAIGRWRNLSLEGIIDGIQDIAVWIPSLLPHVADINFRVMEADYAAAKGDLVISAPRLSRCTLSSRSKIFLQDCDVIREYSTTGDILRQDLPFAWGEFLSTLHANCPTIEILDIGDDNWTLASEETSLEWPPLFLLRILRFTGANHETINLFLNRIVAPKLELVEIVGRPALDGFKPPAIELPNGINWCLRFKNAWMQDIRTTIKAIKTQTWPVVEVDLMGLVPQPTLTALFTNSRGSRVGLPRYAFATVEKGLETDWNWVLDHVPSVTWVIRGPHHQEWVPLVQDRPASLHEVVEHMVGTFGRRTEL
ncbi:hypothetical protein FRC04_002098 [Tulasnella sp. 424]|nr:hypothetical protein FRC04_002098 [Tulasnella sp. 424]KAG8967988.1 hypothetical protein FRC05_001698 [Tulasnella sp. 425]